MTDIDLDEPSNMMQQAADEARWSADDCVSIAEQYIERQGDDPDAMMAEYGSGDDTPESRLDDLLDYIGRQGDDDAFREYLEHCVNENE